MCNRTKSKELYALACKHMPAGVNSPVRAFRNVGMKPIFIEKAKGAYLWDVDGNQLIDYVCSWGPMILGHAYPQVVDVIKEAAENGTSFGACTEKEIEFARIIKEAFPSIDMLRLVSSGTEACMSAIRVARGFTGRDKIIKFEGCYHGHADYLLVKAGSGLATFSQPDSKGVPKDFAKHTLVAKYNDLDSVKNLIAANMEQIAAIIVEPVAGNMGCIPPVQGFLEGLRDICNQYNIVLIFDEVITGFRVAFGGAQELYNIKADLTCLGKIVGGGLPIGAYGGKKEIMEMISPLGGVYQAGTLSGNPLAVSAGISTLSELRQQTRDQRPQTENQKPESFVISSNQQLATSNIYDSLDCQTRRLTDGLSEILTKKDIPHTINRVGSMFSLFFAGDKICNYDDVKCVDTEMFKKYFLHMVNNGIYIAPSAFESSFLSIAHSDDDIEKTIEVVANF